MIYPNRSQTTAAVAAHYDELDLFYREVWGEHVHHGFWATGRESRLAAVEALVDLRATRLDLAPGQALCDIGCGYGATAVRLAERHGVHGTGVTVSGVQATIAAAKSPSHGSIAVLHRDWLCNGFPDRQFDRAYARELRAHAGQAAVLRRGLSYAPARRSAEVLVGKPTQAQRLTRVLSPI
jgi:tocopherol O-methyltransferase